MASLHFPFNMLISIFVRKTPSQKVYNEAFSPKFIALDYCYITVEIFLAKFHTSIVEIYNKKPMFCR